MKGDGDKTDSDCVIGPVWHVTCRYSSQVRTSIAIRAIFMSKDGANAATMVKAQRNCPPRYGRCPGIAAAERPFT